MRNDVFPYEYESYTQKIRFYDTLVINSVT